jgi:cytochrome c-type biogenesis protein CcmH
MIARRPAICAALASAAAALLLGAAATAAAPAIDLASDPMLEARVQALSAELRCLVCQNQSLADSHADLALQLKGQVREQLRAGRHEDEVIAYMTSRYGDFVLYRPPLKATTVLLWAGPALLLALGVLLLLRGLRGAASPTGPVDGVRADALLEGIDDGATSTEQPQPLGLSGDTPAPPTQSIGT